MAGENHEIEIEVGIVRMRVSSSDKDWAADQVEKFLPPSLKAAQKHNARKLEPADAEQLPLFITQEADTQGSSPKQSVSTSQNSDFGDNAVTAAESLELVPFYRKLTTISYSDEVAAIAFWYKFHEKNTEISRDDFDAAYEKLRFASVEYPHGTKLNDRISNAVKADVLIRVRRGVYALTINAEEAVSGMMVNAA